jgi:hypothetical protein
VCTLCSACLLPADRAAGWRVVVFVFGLEAAGSRRIALGGCTCTMYIAVAGDLCEDVDVCVVA